MSSVHPPGDLVVLKTTRGLDDAAVQQALRDFWAEFRDSPELQEEAARAGADVASLTASAEPPFRARRPEAQFDVATTILISVASGVATQAIVALWKVAVWPYLERRFGAKLEPQEDAGQR